MRTGDTGGGSARRRRARTPRARHRARVRHAASAGSSTSNCSRKIVSQAPSPMSSRVVLVPRTPAAAAVAREQAAHVDLVADPHARDALADRVVGGDQVIVRDFVRLEPRPRFRVAGREVAREDAVPEADVAQRRAERRVAPDDAEVGDVQVIVRAPVHEALAVVQPVRHDHPVEVVRELRLHLVGDAGVVDGERRLRRARLPRRVLRARSGTRCSRAGRCGSRTRRARAARSSPSTHLFSVRIIADGPLPRLGRPQPYAARAAIFCATVIVSGDERRGARAA